MEKVLLAEVSKDFIDLLFSLLRLPIGTTVRLLTKNGMVGCIGKLYESIDNLSDDYLLNPKQHKEALLKPSVALICGCPLPLIYNDFLKEDKQILPNPSSSSSYTEQSVIKTTPSWITPPKQRILKSTRKIVSTNRGRELICSPRNGGPGNNLTRPSNLYTCLNICSYSVTEVLGTPCPNCGKSMSSAVQYVDKKTTEITKSCGEGGFVKGLVAYTVMDDLQVHPMSSISTITLLSKFNIKDAASLQEGVVDFGIEEGIKLLKASLQCKNVLTSVFLKNVEE